MSCAQTPARDYRTGVLGMEAMAVWRDRAEMLSRRQS